MPELDFGETDEEAILVLKGFADRVNSDLYNHDRDGLITQFKNFTIEHKTRESERDKQHKASKDRLNIIIALLTMIVLYMTFVATLKGSIKTHLDPEKIFHSFNDDPQTARQVSTIPPLAR